MSKQTKKIFNKIEFLKEKSGHSDRDIAHALGITPSGYSRIKNQQRRLTVDQLEKIASFFNVPFFYLFFTEDDLKKLSFGKTLDGRIELIKLLLEELGLDQSRIESILDYIVQSES
ncbi:hypothetical protein BBF96_10210 [Anoxybacter fermentans]|uniref:HTH cro/C1-type domain-containing protein n=1 Tax=Anoxybacter fermentans TaxID=1323375 RepID=A0A3Q9HRJ8_9FIRM|nr:helix-turn-helix transcriptional regulator [Anoxybacter fermentans]AZR73724.1 hypothetical protein BBF96_10210 [Anoxybacter fermentans]